MDKVFLKLFLGIPITSEVRMHLNHSIQWKEAQILKEFNSDHLLEVPFQEENYVGKFMPANEASIAELHAQEKLIFEKLRFYCPLLKIEKFRVKIFTQQFIS